DAFDHPGSAEVMPWNASAAPLCDPSFLSGLGPELTHLLAPHLERLQTVSLPKLRTLRRQVIHNDMHPGNILLSNAGEISGIIDFGDAIKAPLIQDLAVSSTSLVEAVPHAPTEPLRDLIEGFISAYPLDDSELALLHDAMILRSILSVVLGRVKDHTVPPRDRPRPATAASETGLRAILTLRLPAPRPAPSRGYANE
ncbi:MAG: phosphotransferase, partial [Pseudomonadota bacterium]